jgi:Cellobiose phosphorylase
MRLFRLLSNGTYHVDVDADGSGRSRHGTLALTRWREDGSGDAGGTYLYLHDAESGDAWSATRRPVIGSSVADTPVFDVASTTFSRDHDGVETRLALCVDATRPFEMRRLEVVNRSPHDGC